jgi:hypothetical protein
VAGGEALWQALIRAGDGVFAIDPAGRISLWNRARTLAERLHVSPATIRNHAQNIFAKLEVHSRLEAVAWANQHRVVAKTST